MIEVGSFIELDNCFSGEFHREEELLRLNAGRYGIFHSLKVLGVNKIFLPLYQCPTVSAYLTSQGVVVEEYAISSSFEPLLPPNESDSAVLIVNYFGLLDERKLASFASRFNNVIIDYSQAFFAKPLMDLLNVYSPRKFFGVPDGCYVIGKNAKLHSADYEQDFSSDTASFLLKRIEYGCSKVYAERQLNEKRLDDSGILKMSGLTEYLLNGIDYNRVMDRRKSNFRTAQQLWGDINLLTPELLNQKDVVPMVYPLLVEDEALMESLRNESIYTGRWWNSVLQKVEGSSFEASMSRYMIPLPIDQRYNESTLIAIDKIIRKSMNKK